jgi:hypothetical protein
MTTPHPPLTASLVDVPVIKPVKSMDPYKPCWCGSDAKWCHHRRSEQEPIIIFEIEKKMMDRLRTGYCSYPDPAADPCDGGVVKLHTVQRQEGCGRSPKVVTSLR